MSSPWIEGLPPRVERIAPRIDVCTPTFYNPVEATTLTDRFYCRWKHFDIDTKRPFPCPGHADCKSCRAGLVKYPTAWIACCSTRSFRPMIMQLSDAALGELEEYARTTPLTRGLILQTTRQDRRKNAKMHARVVGRDPRETLPPEYDPRPTLERMFGEAQARLTELAGMGNDKPGRRPGRRGARS